MDSGVVILACYFAQMLEISLLVQIGSGNNYRVIDVKATPGEIVPSKVFHRYMAISGCDAVSAFHGIEKAFWLSTIQKKEEYLDP